MSERDDEPEDAVFEPIPGEHEPFDEPASSSRSPAIVHHVRMQRERDGGVVISAERDDEAARAWGFWLGSAALLALLGFVSLRGAGGGIFALRDVLIVTFLVCLALVMFRFGPKGERRREVIARLDPQGGGMVVWPAPAASSVELVLPIAQISEVVFGMIHFPVSPSRPETRLQVFTVLVRDTSRPEELLPVIEATPEERPAFFVAELLAKAVGVSVTQVGEGVWSEAKRP